MSALGKYVTIFITLIIFLEFVGVPTGASVALSSFGININPNTSALESGDVGNSTFYNWIFGLSGILVVVGAAGAVIIGFFAKSYDTSLVVLPIIVSIGTLLASTSWTVISYCSGLEQVWLTKIVTVIFSALAIGFLWACIDYFRTGN